MEIRIRETGALVTDQQFRAMFPNTGFPIPLTEAVVNDFGGDVVLEGPHAQPTRYQVAFRDGVEQIDGLWFTKYSVSDMEQEARDALDAQQAEAVRKQRNTLLADWVDRMNPIVWETMTDGQKQAWRDYRQALLDVPNQAGFPWDIQWPENPTELAKKN